MGPSPSSLVVKKKKKKKKKVTARFQKKKDFVKKICIFCATFHNLVSLKELS
jgi:hypothetical protein